MNKGDLAARLDELGAQYPDSASRDHLENLLNIFDPDRPKRIVVSPGVHMLHQDKVYTEGDTLEVKADVAMQHVMGGRAMLADGEMPHVLPPPRPGDARLVPGQEPQGGASNGS